MKFLGIAALFSGVMRTAALAAASQLAILEKVPIWSGALPPESNRTSQNSISSSGLASPLFSDDKSVLLLSPHRLSAFLRQQNGSKPRLVLGGGSFRCFLLP